MKRSPAVSSGIRLIIQLSRLFPARNKTRKGLKAETKQSKSK